MRCPIVSPPAACGHSSRLVGGTCDQELSRCGARVGRIGLIFVIESGPGVDVLVHSDACRGGEASALLAGLLVVVERFGQDTERKVRLWRAAL